MYEHNALGDWSGLAICLTKVISSRARCLATALIFFLKLLAYCCIHFKCFVHFICVFLIIYCTLCLKKKCLN